MHIHIKIGVKSIKRVLIVITQKDLVKKHIVLEEKKKTLLDNTGNAKTSKPLLGVDIEQYRANLASKVASGEIEVSIETDDAGARCA